jgi:hypothetical protein
VIIEVALPRARREARVALGGMALKHRARALALAAAELVDALAAAVPPVAASPDQSRAPTKQPVPATVQAERTTPPAMAPATATATTTTTTTTTTTARSPSALLGGTVDWLGKPATLLVGARLSYLHPLGGFVTPMLSLDGNVGEATSSVGRVAARTVAGGIHVLLRAPLGRLRVDIGPGLRFGWVHLAGKPEAGSILEGHALSAWWGGPEVRMRTTTTWGRGWAGALELGAGLVVLPVRGLVDGGAAAYALDGAWLSLALQLGVDLKR